MRTVLLLLTLAARASAADLRVGIIGTDTSHSLAFAELLNDPASPRHIPGARIVAAFKGGSPDIETSRARVEGFAERLRADWGVELVPDAASLCRRVDRVMILAADGRKHLEYARHAAAAGKPMFIDKPLAATLQDAREIARIASAAGVPWFSSSGYRFADFTVALQSRAAKGAIAWGPGPVEEHHYLELSWYAIHPIEMLFALMGPGCEEVTRQSGADTDVVTGRWKGDRFGVVRISRTNRSTGAVVFHTNGETRSDPEAKFGYAPLLHQVVRFFQTLQPPVSNAETLELFEFLDAAQRSKETGGSTVRLR